MAAPHDVMKKWIRRVALALTCFLALLAAGVFLGGPRVVRHYLAKEWRFGESSLTVIRPDFSWGWRITGDSLVFSSPGLEVASGPIRISADLFQSLWKWSPQVAVELDTVQVTLIPTAEEPDTSERKDPFAPFPFPEFNIPVQVALHAQRLAVLDSTGTLVYLEDVSAATRGQDGLGLSVSRLGGRPLDSLAFNLKNEIDWSGDSAHAQVRLQGLQSSGDSVSLAYRGPKADLIQGNIHCLAAIPSAQPYARALGLPKTLPDFSGIRWDATASVGRGFRIRTELKSHIRGFSESAPYRLSPQRFLLALDFSDTAGEWSVQSHGEKRESLDFSGSLQMTETDSLLNPGYLIRHLALRAQGDVRHLPLRVAGKTIMAKMDFTAPMVSAKRMKLALTTGDGSVVQADLSQARTGWGGTFNADILPQESWVRAFVDTVVAFSSLRVKGEVNQSRVKATTDLTGLKAYGAMAEKLHLRHEYGDGFYRLLPSTWTQDSVTWHLRGEIGLDGPNQPMEFHLAHEKWGSLDFKLPRKDLFTARLQALVLDKLPYAPLDTLASYRTEVSGQAEWDKKGNAGLVDLNIRGSYKNQPLSLAALGHWNSDSLVLEKFRVFLEGSSLQADAILALHGRPFYEVAKLKREDYRHVAIQADHFDMAKVLGIALPESPLLSGRLHGRLAYGDSTGFTGEYRFEEVKPRATADRFTLKYLVLRGQGDSLVVIARTVSDKNKWMNDSLRLAVSGILNPDQDFRLFLQSDKTLDLKIAGRIENQKRLSAGLDLRGGMALPGQAGDIKNLSAAADIELPFAGMMDSMEVRVKKLEGDYALPDFPTQHFSAPLTIRSGELKIPNLTLSDGKNEPLQGKAEYALSGNPVYAVELRGPSLAVKFGKENTAKLRGIAIQVRGNSTSLAAEAEIEGLAGEYVDPPLRAYAGLSRIKASYRQSMGKKRGVNPSGQDIPQLRLNAIMDTSLVKYRLRSMETLQNLFRRGGKGKRVAKRSNPLDLKIKIETSGSGNSVETDILRMEYVGDFALNGVMPFALVQGRVNATQGQLGTKNQAYEIRNMEVKWLNVPLEEGAMELEAGKQLARDCEATTTDSCQIITRLNGPLSDLKFSYDSDCQGAYGTGADVSALVYSVRRGCFSSAFSTGGGGSYGEAALTLLEPVASQYLTELAEKLSGKWISSAQVTGLGAISSSGKSTDSTVNTQQAIAIEVLSKEVYRVRLRAKSAYTTENSEAASPWDYRLALEWRPPLEGLFDSPKGKQRVSSQLKLEAALFTDRNTAIEGRESEARRSLGLVYFYDFWGRWGESDAPAPAAPDSLR